LAVASLGNKGFQNFSFMIDGMPQVMCFSIDLHKYLVQVPSPVGMILGRMKSFLPYFTCEQRTEPVPPITHSLMANIDAPFMKKVFKVLSDECDTVSTERRCPYKFLHYAAASCRHSARATLR
jgi:hypothetical protein